MAVNKNLSKILLIILIVSILLVPIIVYQHSMYRLKTYDNEEGIQKCVDEGFLTREKCEEVHIKVIEDFLEDYKKVPLTKKYGQMFLDSFSYRRYWYSWIIPLILFLVYLKIRKKK